MEYHWQHVFVFNYCVQTQHAEINIMSMVKPEESTVTTARADLERTLAAVTRHSLYDTPLTCFQYGAPNQRFTSEMGRNTIPLRMECGARRPGRMGLRLTD